MKFLCKKKKHVPTYFFELFNTTEKSNRINLTVLLCNFHKLIWYMKDHSKTILFMNKIKETMSKFSSVHHTKVFFHLSF